MKKTLTLAEAREMYGETVYETETGFLVNKFGKYRPNITFVIPKTFDLGKDGKVIDPLSYTADREVTDNMNVDFDGDASFIFGDFWRSKKGGACFRPKNPMQAKHLLICISWGGCFNSHRGMSTSYADECGALYFRSASSNGGGTGNDYVVFPVEYKHSCYDPEFDGEATESSDDGNEARAKVYRKKHADLQKKAVEEADAYLKEKAASEEASRNARESFIPRLTEIKAELAELEKPQKSGKKYWVGQLSFEESYFNIGGDQYLYDEKNLAEAEKYLVDSITWIAAEEEKEQAKADARAAFGLRFEELRGQIERFGWELTFDEEGARVKNPARASTAWHGSDGTITYSYNQEGLDAILAEIKAEEGRLAAIEAAERKAQEERAAKAAGLPSDIRIWKRTGASTGCGKGWVIRPDGTDRERDELYNEDSRRAKRYDEGDEIWHQILPGELVIEWSKGCTAMPHMFRVVYQPPTITEAQLERVAEIQQELEEAWAGRVGLASKKPSPPVGKGWGLF